MNPFVPIFLALTTTVLLTLFGYWLRGRSAKPGGAVLDSPPWFSRQDAVVQLRALRDELELDGQFCIDQALLLFDVCSYLGLDEFEIQTIVGVVWLETIIDEPADLDGLELEDY